MRFRVEFLQHIATYFLLVQHIATTKKKIVLRFDTHLLSSTVSLILPSGIFSGSQRRVSRLSDPHPFLYTNPRPLPMRLQEATAKVLRRPIPIYRNSLIWIIYFTILHQQ